MRPSERLQKLFQYDVWANKTIIAALEKHSEFKDRAKSLGMLYHIIGSQHHWYRRITGAKLDNIEIWPEFELTDCLDLIEVNGQRWRQLIEEKKDDPDQKIAYTNSKGVAYETPLSDILHHLIIHGQHHRAQIALLMRQSGIAPPATDFIFYDRRNS